MQDQHHNHGHERERESRRHSERRRRWRRKRALNILINGGVIAATIALVFLFDYLVGLKEQAPVDTPNNTVVDQQTTSTTADKAEEEVTTALVLPEHTYAYVNQPICYYFLNLTGFNSLEDIQVEVETGGKGRVYEDRWEYTPKKAETVTFAFTARNKNDKIISQGKCIIEVKARSEKDKLTMLVIGDSTIEAGYETQQLLELAAENGCQLKLLGTQTTPYLKNNNNRHEGRGGWHADYYAKKRVQGDTLNPFYNPTSRGFDFTYYMESQWYTDVDCVCIQLGINDVFYAASDLELSQNYIPRYLSRMDSIIESIHEYDPDIKVIWNLVLPGSVEQKKFEIAYGIKQTADRYKRNTYLTNLEIVKHTAEMENVYVAPTNALMDTHVDMAGSGHGAVHPGESGYQKIGEYLYWFVRAIN